MSLTRNDEMLTATMDYKTDPSCLDRLQREALTCLNGFPNKVRALNDIMGTYAPEITRRILKTTTSTIPEIPLTQQYVTKESNSGNLDAISLSSASILNQRISTTKRKHHRGRRSEKRIIRRRSGPLAHILAFLSNSLAVCTRTAVIRPSRYIANHALAILRDTLIQRGQLIHVQCGSSTIWPLPEGRTSLKLPINRESTVNNCIKIMKPAAAQLIADTTKLKHWLQALAVTFAPPATPLIHAIRRTEAIDGWAYELFFRLKYIQENRIRKVEKTAAAEFEVSDDMKNTSLWRQLIQLRDNYVHLYETLYSKSLSQVVQRVNKMDQINEI